jgi:aspartyl-tRNA(Asn)/glutamyl-tRNA(Gln) amidotransferase subunit A
MEDDLALMSASDLLIEYSAKRLSPVEVSHAVIRRIEKFNSAVNAFCLVDEEAALASAKRSEARWLSGVPLGIVDGIPTTIKDLLLSKNWPTIRGSRTVSRDQKWTDDAPSVANLRRQGAVFIGKTTTSEFGWKPLTDSPLLGPTKNPWNTNLVSGGSSGGAAVAAALGMGALHIGTDGAGSVRIPASFCGVFGLKPTYGRIPAFPHSPASSFATVGAITRTVSDAALMLSAMTGYDPRDSYALPQDGRDWRIGLEGGVSNLRIAYAATINSVNVDNDVAQGVDNAANTFASLGAQVENVELQLDKAQETLEGFYRTAMQLTTRYLSKHQRKLLDPELKEFADSSGIISTSSYFRLVSERERLTAELNKLFCNYDLLILPTVPIAAFEIGLTVPVGSDYRSWFDWTPFSGPFNLTKHPAASIACGMTNGLPVGLQIVGPHFRDDLVLRACSAFEDAHPICLPAELVLA